MARKKNKTSPKTNFFKDHLPGLSALTISLFSLVISSPALALLAITIGGLSVWGYFKNQTYEFLFLGITAIVVALASIWITSNHIMSTITY